MRYIFENYAFDTDRRELRRGADVVSVTPQVFDLLDYLIRNRERVVSKDDLINVIWSGRSVSDAALTTRLNGARSAIGDSGEEQRLIKTLPRKGFRFIGPVRGAPTSASVTTDTPAPAPKPALPLPDKPSIAVLPFTNLNSDPEQEYFADGMAEDIITGLSRSKSLFVIARNSSFSYKGKAVDIKQVGRDLGVRYVLEGSVRKSGKRVRVTGQLIDASSGNHIWADRFESELEDIFDLQDRVTGSVIGAIMPHLERAEMERAQRKPTENLQAYDYYFRALYSHHRFTREANIEALQLSQTACTLDPMLALAYALGCLIMTQRKSFGWSTDIAGERDEAVRLARRAIGLDRDDPLVLGIAGQTLSVLAGELEEAGALLARSISLDSNLASARYWCGLNENYLGNFDAAIEQFQVALRLSPLDPRIFIAQTGLAQANFLTGRYEQGLFWATAAIRQQPSHVFSHRVAMSCHAMMGQLADARRICAQLLQMVPELRISGFRDHAPFRRPEDIEKITHAWRLAGVPE